MQRALQPRARIELSCAIHDALKRHMFNDAWIQIPKIGEDSSRTVKIYDGESARARVTRFH